MSLYAGLEASSSSMYLIHSFWLVALAVADRMAISPLPPICSEISLVWIKATSLATTWLMKMSRQSGLVSESNATILAPAERASPRAVQTASGSLAAIAMTFVPACVSALMNETWLEAEASSGPTTCEEANPASVAPFLPPPRTTSVYGLFSCLGMKVIFWSPPPAEGLLVSVEDAEPLLQAVSASAATAVMATMLPSRPVRPLFLRFNIIVLPFSFVRSVQPVPGGRGLWWCWWANFRWPCG